MGRGRGGEGKGEEGRGKGEKGSGRSSPNVRDALTPLRRTFLIVSTGFISMHSWGKSHNAHRL